MVIAIGRIMKENSLIGLRIFDTETHKTKDIRIEDKNKIKIKNLKSINKLGVVDNRQEDKPIIVIGEKDNKYLTIDINGNYKATDSLDGYTTIDLLTNIEHYNKYQAKQSLVGNLFEFEIKEDTDEVILAKYNNINTDYEVIEIPEFVTDIKIELDSNGWIESSPFTGVKQSLKVIYRGNKITSMRGMFFDYKGIELDLSNFNTSKVTDMRDMFMGSSLTPENTGLKVRSDLR